MRSGTFFLGEQSQKKGNSADRSVVQLQWEGCVQFWPPSLTKDMAELEEGQRRVTKRIRKYWSPFPMSLEKSQLSADRITHARGRGSAQRELFCLPPNTGT